MNASNLVDTVLFAIQASLSLIPFALKGKHYEPCSSDVTKEAAARSSQEARRRSLS